MSFDNNFQKFDGVDAALLFSENPNPISERMKKEIDLLAESYNKLLLEVKKYREGTRENEIIGQLTKENRLLRTKLGNQYTCGLDEEEYKRASEWFHKHYEEKHSGCRGCGYPVYTITPTELGTIKECSCRCGEVFTITDL